MVDNDCIVACAPNCYSCSSPGTCSPNSCYDRNAFDVALQKCLRNKFEIFEKNSQHIKTKTIATKMTLVTPTTTETISIIIFIIINKNIYHIRTLIPYR